MDFAKVPKDICMTFILKHPENRIVQYHARPGLVLVAAAKLTPSNGHVSFVPISDIRNKYELSCWYPRQYQFMNPQKVRE